MVVSTKAASSQHRSRPPSSAAAPASRAKAEDGGMGEKEFEEEDGLLPCPEITALLSGKRRVVDGSLRHVQPRLGEPDIHYLPGISLCGALKLLSGLLRRPRQAEPERPGEAYGRHYIPPLGKVPA